MNKSSTVLIREYYEKVKDKYPDVSFTVFNDICRHEFKVLKKEMKSGELKNVRMMHLGVFVVFPGRAKGLLNRTKKMLLNEKIPQDTYDYIYNIVKRYFKRNFNIEL